MHARLVSPDGTYVADERLPYFRLPPWVRDPFAEEPAAEPAGDSAARPAREPAATASRAP
ncbi:class III lanthionine synthetase LanKC N-terminal domain-containing protein [Streptomyces nojiriensis]